MQNTPLIIRLPFRGLRFLIGGLFGLTSIALVIGLSKGVITVLPSLISALFLAGVSLLWFGLEHIIVIAPGTKQFKSYWCFFNIPTGNVRTCDLNGADRIKIHKKRCFISVPNVKPLHRILHIRCM
ncbi:MAG: hypothetical protein COS99_05870 [Candidatus Omnitrophica bacterium CG07_land_8_20_14_0_80_42_15]|uniref:Uncharacterized protein n=1 Tax=Candidatus Aquitaenariimonas noxiae TaxID=1974741 RepID=A0A2J0KS81_9BACT|nr:MAG: hypothetical protein COS99_05870 [Candidatus Omnitrophica bacterium CG07_land_8_20_14_0_80_42_15]